MSAATGLVATVDVARDAGVRRVGPRTDGADLRVVPGSSVPIALLAGSAGPALLAGRAAASAAGAEVVLVLRADVRASLVERAAALREARPSVVLLLPQGGEDLTELAEALRLGCAAQEPAPTVLVAADERVRARLAPSLLGFASEAVADAAGPHGREAIVARVRAMRRGAGALVLRDEAVDAAARALAAATARSTLVVDVSGATTSLAYASPSGDLVSAHAHVGVGARADRVVARAGLDRVRRWMPRAIDGPALLERVFNRARWPDAVATDPLTLALEMALARECIGHALADAERCGVAVAPFRSAQLIACTGVLARFPRAAQTVLVAVDALAPASNQLVARERPDALIAAGAIASRSPAAVAAAIEPLALVATMSPRRAVAVRVNDATGTIEARVVRGAFLLVPTTGAVELTLPGVPSVVTADALALGVVIDARGRPVELPQRDAERLPAVARWHAALDALPSEAAAR